MAPKRNTRSGHLKQARADGVRYRSSISAASDPVEAYALAASLGRPVALGLLDRSEVRAAVILYATKLLTNHEYDPIGLSVRMAWAVNDAISGAEMRQDNFEWGLTRALVDKLRGLSPVMTEEQEERAFASIEALVFAIYEREKRPIMSDQLDAVANRALRAARRRLGRERRQ